MAIKHAFTNPKANGPDATIVRPSDWNASHTIENDTVTYAQIQNVSATDKLLGRATAGAGDIEEIACTAAGRALLDDANAAAQRTTLGLAAVAASGSGADLTDGTVTLAKLANLTTQRVIGRNTAGAGAAEEVSASQLLDWVSNTNGVLLTRTGGSWAAASRVAIHDSDLTLDVASMSAPAAEKVKLAGATFGGRQMLAFMNEHGRTVEVQPFLGRRFTCELQAIPGTNNHDVVGMSVWSSTGTPGSKALGSTSDLDGARRIGVVSAAAANSIASWRHAVLQFWRGNATGRGGFHGVWRFANDDAVIVATGRTFVGLLGQTAAPADADPSTFTNVLGVGNDNGDANMQLYSAGAVAQARVDLGANFPANTVGVDFYELHLFAAPNAAAVKYELRRINTGHTASGSISNAANLPASTQFMAPHFWRGNGGTASAVTITYSCFYAETEI